MARTFFWIVCVALTQTTAHKYPSYHNNNDRNYEVSQDQKGYDQNMEEDASLGYQGVDSDEMLYRSETRNIFTPQVTEDCEKKGYCENSPDYPHEYVEALLATLPAESAIFKMDAEPERVEEDSENKTLCDAVDRVITPDKVKTHTGKWVYVINGRSNKIQGVRGTTCRSNQTGMPCQNIKSKADGSPICVQKYTNRVMWTLGDSGEMVQMNIRVPSCCVCEVKIKKHFHRSLGQKWIRN